MAADTVADKLLYVPDRYTDIQQLAVLIAIHNFGEYNVQMCFFESHNPEKRFELAISQGVPYKCSGCGVRTDLYTNLRRCMLSKRLSVEDRQGFAMSGVFRKQTCHASSMHGRKRNQLELELPERDVDTTGPKKDLSERLEAELKGTHRALTLLYR